MVEYKSRALRSKDTLQLSGLWEPVFESRLHKPFVVRHSAGGKVIEAHTTFDTDPEHIEMNIQSPKGALYIPTMLLFHEQGHIEFDSPSHIKRFAGEIFKEPGDNTKLYASRDFFNAVDDVIIDRKYATSYQGYVEGNQEILEYKPSLMAGNKLMELLRNIRLNTPEKDPEIQEIAQLADQYIDTRDDNDYLRLARRVAKYLGGVDEPPQDNGQGKPKNDKEKQDGGQGNSESSDKSPQDKLDSPVDVDENEIKSALFAPHELVVNDQRVSELAEQNRDLDSEDKTYVYGATDFNKYGDMQVFPTNETTYKLASVPAPLSSGKFWSDNGNTLIFEDLPDLRKQVDNAVKQFVLKSKRSSRSGRLSTRMYIRAKYNNPNTPVFKHKAKIPISRGKFLLVLDGSGSMYPDLNSHGAWVQPAPIGPLVPGQPIMSLRLGYIFLDELGKQLKRMGAKVEEISFTTNVYHGLVTDRGAGTSVGPSMLKYFKSKVDEGYTIVIVTDEQDSPGKYTVEAFKKLDSSIGLKNSALILTTPEGGQMFGSLKHAHRVAIGEKKDITKALNELGEMLEEKYT